ncbi:DUF1295 domain-containing protein [Leptospira ilyithenensis]|uniref:DUF1295 domain-containing protein n=1 Tax=Leptospira ilyithenensis TaxID=2484901 RepID=A0A4R9LQP4_9LEPT|nr:DUF1295 domain-containing protein [Leptospira ilyithenensis]TGN10219.1 DUF1295 domain-containing protein [Leptospira ilyithenensis]
MNLITFPALTDAVIYTYGFYIFLSVFVFKLESSGTFNLPYSKFAKGHGVSPKVGMFIIYFLPILAYLYTWNTSDNPKLFYQWITLIAFVIHFGKRCLEVLFLHKFSGKIGMLGVFFITIAYSNIGLITGSLHNHTSESHVTQIPVWWTALGATFFSIGQIGNLYHHILLTKLRSGNEKEYKIPNQGLFQKLVCPHYFFELVSWLGFAILSTYADSFFILMIMTAYLSGRSNRTREWYIEKLPGFPLERKRILPGIY